MMKPRLFYLDNLKAFAILAVIASHVNSFVFSNGGCFMNKVIDTFFMGTFFLVSGYVGYRAFAEKVSLRKFLEVKTYNLLIPLFVVGTFYVLCHDLAANGSMTVNPLLRMITNGDQMGYWFLLTLFVFRMMALVTAKFMDKPIRRFTTLGIHSLEVYVLHYFVIIGCSDYSAIWIEGIKKMPFLFQLMLCVGVTAVIATVTMLIARVVNHNAVIKKFVLGKF